ncbi:C6 zinc finger domain protein, partial [Colletotrichum musicola]
MFGTLMYDLHHNEPTFVENNPEAVINRNRRGKPHIACEFCRARKLRCNGNPNGCDRCKSASQVCKYPATRGVIRKRKQSSASAKGSSQPRQQGLGDSTAPQSPALSDHFSVDPSLLFENHGGDNTASVSQHNPLPSPAMDLPPCSSDILGDIAVGQNESHDQDQIDQWLASCSLLSPNGTIDISSLRPADFGNSWQDNGKDMAYFDDACDSGDDAASSQETQLEDIDMNGMGLYNLCEMARREQKTDSIKDNNETIDGSSSTPCLSASSLDMLLDENFPTTSVTPPTDAPTSSRSQPSRKATPVSYKMSAPATSPLSALLESAESTFSKKKSECRCLRLAAHLLEQLGNEGANTEQPTMDGLLNCCREAIKGCDSILGCTLCKSRSESMMLLAMAGQYLSNICEKTVRCYVDVVQQSQASPATTLAGGAAMWFRSYKIESTSERNQVLRCLVTGQLTEFCQLIGKIKARVGTRRA